MLIKNNLLLFPSACLLMIIAFISCHSSKEVAHKSSRQPKFIDNVYMDGHNKSNATTNAITPQKKRSAGRTEHLETTTPKLNTAMEETADKDPIVPKRIYTKEETKSISKKYADVLNVRTKDINNLTLYSFIDKWYGTNYRLGGHDRSGIDCSGFAQKLYDEVYGIDLLRTSVEQFGNCQRIKKIKDAVEGDLVFFKVHGRRISHVGIYLMNDYFVHASTSNGVMISNLNEEYWHKSFAGIGRIPRG